MNSMQHAVISRAGEPLHQKPHRTLASPAMQFMSETVSASLALDVLRTPPRTTPSAAIAPSAVRRSGDH